MSKRVRATFTGEIDAIFFSGESWVHFTDECGHAHLVHVRGDWANGVKARVTIEQIPPPKRRKP